MRLSFVKPGQEGLWRSNRLLLCLPVLVPILILVGTGLRGLDFGVHWDERPWQIGPIKHMIGSRTLLPGYYNYPSFDYWLNLLTLAPDAMRAILTHDNLPRHLLRVSDSHAFLLRLREVYLILTSVSLLWVYLLVWQRGRSVLEALLAALFLGGSWEVAYHLRWIATDGMLMQFAALGVLLSYCALKTKRQDCLLAAAAVAGLGFATKYPGGLLVMPVALAGLLSSGGLPFRQKVERLSKVMGVFLLVFSAVTPAMILEPAKVRDAIEYETTHYAAGHGGHTIARGPEHAWRMLEYFATRLFSSNVEIAIFLFVLALFGLAVLFSRNWREAAVLFAFPILYLIYFSSQRAMIVRNLLAVAPFLALAAAAGSCVVTAYLSALRNRWLRTMLPPVWLGILAAVICSNALWLVSSANSIVLRHTDHFIGEASKYIRAHPEKQYLLSPRVVRDLRLRFGLPENVIDDAAQADGLVLYAHEGMRGWREWPANWFSLTEARFGPDEVNFDMYPNWYGDDRIVVITRHRAEQIHLSIAGISPRITPLPGLSPVFTAKGSDNGAEARSSWLVPDVNPCNLFGRAEAETIMGAVERGPMSGGWDLDGRACTFIGRDGTVVSITVVSTSAFDLYRHELTALPLAQPGVNAYTIPGADAGDLRLFARSRRSAVIIHVTSASLGGELTEEIAQQFARKALEELDHIGA